MPLKDLKVWPQSCYIRQLRGVDRDKRGKRDQIDLEIGDDDGRLRQMELLRMELGEPDDSGRRRPVPIEGSEFIVDIDTAVVAIGNSPNPLIPQTTPDIETKKWGNIIADEESCKTSKKGVFAGGDIVLGAATVILAMGAGRIAAKAIDEYVRTGVW